MRPQKQSEPSADLLLKLVLVLPLAFVLPPPACFESASKTASPNKAIALSKAVIMPIPALSGPPTDHRYSCSHIVLSSRFALTAPSRPPMVKPPGLRIPLDKAASSSERALATSFCATPPRHMQ